MLDTRVLTLEVAGLTMAVRAGSARLDLALAGSSRSFVSSSTAMPDLDLCVEWKPLQPAGGEQVFDSGGTWRLYRESHREVYRFFDPRVGAAPYKEVWLEPGERSGQLYLDPRAYVIDEPTDALQFPLDEVLFLRMLSAHDGIELHACGVVTPSGDGLLFVGHSGDGKTTTARLWSEVPGAQVLSDDRIVLRHQTGRWWMHGTPWHGEGQFALNARAPLTALLVLARGENALEPLTAVEAVSALIARSFVPLYKREAVSRALAGLDAVAAAIGCRRFCFTPDTSAVAFLRRTL